MIQSTKRDHQWSFWCQGGCNYQEQEFFGGKRALKVAEAIESAEVNEAVEVAKAMKITTEVFKVLGFNNSMKKFSLF
jgi:hypothetical protein